MMRRFSILTLVVAFHFFSCGSDTSGSGDYKLSDIPVPEIPVTTMVCKSDVFDFLIATSGIVQSMSEAQVQFKGDGIIEDIYVSSGDWVKKGQLLAGLESTHRKLLLKKATVQLEEKRISFEDLMMGFKGVQDSLNIKSIRRNVSYSSGLAAAEIQHQEAELNYNNGFLHAVSSGIVSNLSLKKGNPVTTGQVLCFIHDPQQLSVSCNVIESDAFRLQKKFTAKIRPVSDRDAVYQAVVTNINPRVDEQSGMVRVDLQVTEPRRLIPGMHVLVEFKVPGGSSIIIPKEAVVIRSGKNVVFTMQDGLAKWNYVTLGNDNGREVEVLQGLTEGEQVIVSNIVQLSHNTVVVVRNTPGL